MRSRQTTETLCDSQLDEYLSGTVLAAGNPMKKWRAGGRQPPDELRPNI
jgi:hypothetical protein